jgi:hypothetical protein
MYSDYFCKEDNLTIEIKKEMGKPFPPTVLCTKCGKPVGRVYSSPIVSISQGSILHGSDYVPSDFTPLSKVHGRTTSWVGDNE